jgi:hypothetical protein
MSPTTAIVRAGAKGRERPGFTPGRDAHRAAEPSGGEVYLTAFAWHRYRRGCMRSVPALAASLACLVVAYTTFAPFLECGMHRAEGGRAAASTEEPAGGHHHHHGYGGPAGHAERGAAPVGHAQHGATPASPRAGDPSGPACCHASLYNVVFQSLSPLALLRADAASQMLGFVHTPTTLAAGAGPGIFHPGTGPPSAAGPNTSLFPARPQFLAVSSFLI